MSNRIKKREIVDFVKKYYSKNKKTPSIKIISDNCIINNREIYEYFKNKKELCEAANVPYDEKESEKTKKAIKARIIKRKEKINKPKTGYVNLKLVNIDYNNLEKIIIDNKNITDSDDNLIQYFQNEIEKICNKLLIENPPDIKIIFNSQILANLFLTSALLNLHKLQNEYDSCVKMRDDLSYDKTYYINKGWDFDDLKGSREKFQKGFLKETYEKSILNMSEKEAFYFRKMIGDFD